MFLDCPPRPQLVFFFFAFILTNKMKDDEGDGS
jgi:hypothetical protein